MVCPDDGSDLTEDEEGVSSCGRCRGHAIRGETFSRIHDDVRQMLRAEQNRESGAYARPRRCPRCDQAMVPLRMGEQLAWLESCAPCGLLWVDKLDEAVIARLERRKAITTAVEALPEAERRELARDIAGELADEQRRLRVIKVIREVLSSLAGW